MISFGFSKSNKKNNQSRASSKTYKSEPFLHKHKAGVAKRVSAIQKNQDSEFDNYFYQLPSIELFARSSIKYSQTKEAQKTNQQLRDMIPSYLYANPSIVPKDSQLTPF